MLLNSAILMIPQPLPKKPSAFHDETSIVLIVEFNFMDIDCGLHFE